MSIRSPFTRISELPALAPLFKQTGGRHIVLSGLLGASRSLLAGALARSHSPAPPRVLLFVTDTPDSALDVLGDLRAFTAVEEACAPPPPPRSAAERKKKKLAYLANEEKWAVPGSAGFQPANEGRQDACAPSPLESTLFPAWDVLPTESDRPEGLTLAGRRRVTERLREIRGGNPSRDREGAVDRLLTRAALNTCYLIVTPITALMQPCEAPEQTGELLTLATGAEHDPILLGRKLMDLGYDRTGQVEVRGEFSLRGGILDIFPYTSETPYRLDFLGDTIESIKPFDPLSQRSDDPVAAISFADASPNALKRLFSPGANRGPASLFDHLPAATLVIFQDPPHLRQRAELYQASLVSGRSVFFKFEELLAQAREKTATLQLTTSVASNTLTPPTPPFQGGENIPPALKTGDEGAVVLPPLKRGGRGGEEGEDPNESDFLELEAQENISLACTTLQRLEGNIAANAQAWKKLAVERGQALVFCETPGQRQRLQTLFEAEGVMVAQAFQPVSQPGKAVLPSLGIALVFGRLSCGFDLRQAGMAAISDREILGSGKHPQDETPKVRHKHPSGSVALQHIMDVQAGDYVVHAAHGIARYLGLARLEKSGRLEDYLTLLFADDVKLYVPAAHIGWVSKYIGGRSTLELSTLGGKAWAKKKERASAALRDIAEDLLALQGARRSLPGIVFPPDNEWQGPFEAAFPYEETADQLTAIHAVKKDMEGTCPMDRLICGDVGFGKTEVALRAAFKAAASGKQVAVLAPTTLLAEQHGRTFRERFASYPLAVDVLSRFKPHREQARLLDKLASGRLDVVIGTHRLLQRDVRFKDLGLAIIDEEQRFGVEHKEFFKHLRKSVDVLTLTATPIPRTLHMALIGLRDISNLATPPRNRRPIITKVARVSDDLLRRALLRELSRGGQVFVVHPRVHDIEDFKTELARLVPEARFATGHGQMDTAELEGVMARFLGGELDVLVSTTIVESGLDIPTANTILIHEADHFGLGELHQLRGRVGRSDLQAYCYLLLPQHNVLTPEGLRRLRALEEFDELGAGFQIALKDLEIRGAGNVLGRQQSGEIAEIGYDLYCKLLDATVKKLRGEVTEEELEVNLQLRGAAYIPETYVQDDKAVLEIYRRLDATRTEAEVDRLKEELCDRFGPLPQPAERMFEEAKLRRLARLARIPYVGLDHEEGRLIMKLHNWDLKRADRALRGLPELKGVRVLDGETLSFGMTPRSKRDEGALRELVKNLLEPLVHFRQKFTVSDQSAEPPPLRAFHA